MEYVKKLVGERIYLSPMRMEDAPVYVRWLNDPRVTDGLGASARVLSLEEEQAWIKQNAASPEFAIVRLEDDALLGNCGLSEIRTTYRRADIGLFLGEEENRGKGYGTEALRLLLDYGFLTLNLHNIMLQVYSFNRRAIACYQKVGFQEIGRRREAYYCNGAYYDTIYMDLLKREWLRREQEEEK